MREKNIAIAVPAGLIATAVMAVVMLLAPLAGIPEINLPRAIGWWIGLPLSGGLILFFLFGIVAAMLFVIRVYGRLSLPLPLLGTLFGVGLWLCLMTIGGPLIGWGMFASKTGRPLGTLLTTLVGHIAIGGTLGFAYERVIKRMRSR